MSIKLGIAPIAWSNDDMPELGGDTSLEQCLKEASLAGFSGIESGGKFPKNSKELLPKLDKENLQLCSGWYGAKLLTNTAKDELELMRNQLNLFKDCNAPCMVFAEITNSIQADPKIALSKKPKLSKDDWNKLILRMNEISKMMLDENMPLAYHHHMGTVIETEEETRRLIENTNDSVRLLIDTGHMLFAQGNSIKLVQDFSDRLIHVHCKDIRKEVDTVVEKIAPLQKELEIIRKLRPRNSDIIIIDDLRLYAKDNYQNENCGTRVTENIDWVVDLMGDKFGCLKSLEDEGYLVIVPHTDD